MQNQGRGLPLSLQVLSLLLPIAAMPLPHTHSWPYPPPFRLSRRHCSGRQGYSRGDGSGARRVVRGNRALTDSSGRLSHAHRMWYIADALPGCMLAVATPWAWLPRPSADCHCLGIVRISTARQFLLSQVSVSRAETWLFLHRGVALPLHSFPLFLWGFPAVGVARRHRE